MEAMVVHPLQVHEVLLPLVVPEAGKLLSESSAAKGSLVLRGL
jgi:hypothetical protein